MCSDAPDTTYLEIQAREAAALGREALDWYKAKDAAEAPLRQAAADKAMEVADAQLAAMRENTALSKDYADYQKNTFRPLEQGIVADAQTYDTPEKRNAAAAAAQADVNKGFSASNEATMRRLAAEGVDPGSARAVAAMGDRGVDQAVANAGAAYKARQGVETVGRAMKMDAANLGRNLASNQATSAQIALQAGNSATTNAGQPVQQSQSATGTYGAGFNTGLQGTQIAGNLYGQAANLQAQDNSGAWGALGQLGGAAISKWSDENLKTEIEPVDEDEALEEVTSTPVSTWKYDPAAMAKRGLEIEPEDEGENTGPMAQDVAKTMGPSASNGQKVNLVSMVGKTMAAVQAVDKKVNSLAAMIRGGQLQAGAA